MPRDPLPLYRQIKDYILASIESGVWPPGHRVPSENELVRQFGLSRMTANRAVRELTAEGRLTRVRGVGTFVADARPQLEMLALRNIAEEVRARGHRHRLEVVERGARPAAPTEALALGVTPDSRVFHSLVVHSENGVPIQLEDRLVNPAVAPDYLTVDFQATTPNEYLTRVAPLSEVEHTVEAVIPDGPTRRHLRIAATEPCLRVRRRTWSEGQVASAVTLTHPGSRYRVHARFAATPAGSLIAIRDAREGSDAPALQDQIAPQEQAAS